MIVPTSSVRLRPHWQASLLRQGGLSLPSHVPGTIAGSSSWRPVQAIVTEAKEKDYAVRDIVRAVAMSEWMRKR